MYTLFEYKTKYQEEEVAKIKSKLFQVIAGYTLRKSEKLIILRGITLNESPGIKETTSLKASSLRVL